MTGKKMKKLVGSSLLLGLVLAGSASRTASAFTTSAASKTTRRGAAVPAVASFVSPAVRHGTALASTAAVSAEAGTEPQPVRTAGVVGTVAVAGATGRTGSLVVTELLRRGVSVVALVRDEDKAAEVLPSDPSKDEAALYEGSEPPSLSVVTCNLGDEKDIKDAVVGCDAAIWCATGFSDAPATSIINRVKGIFGAALTPQRSIDAVGIPALAEAFAPAERTGNPRVVMLSSAGVTRPSWDDDKKAKFEGSADIPIVRLNPFGILDVKAASEERLRNGGVDYCIVRPGGLNDKWPAGSRPVFSQGDLAVGRINRADVAKILVDCLSTPEAAGKTFEAVSLAGYAPAASSIGRALSRLRPDSLGEPSMEVLEATYSAMQQLLPGETQAPERLAMGQTYEQLDRGETGRLGERGTEDAEAAAPKPSS